MQQRVDTAAMPLLERRTADRRDAEPKFSSAFEKKLTEHMDKEEDWERKQAVKAAVDKLRFEEGAAKMELLAEELAPVKKMYYAVLGCGGIGVLLMALMMFVYNADRQDAKDDRKDFRALAVAVSEQSASIKVILERQQTMKDEQDRVRRVLDGVGNGGRK